MIDIGLLYRMLLYHVIRVSASAYRVLLTGSSAIRSLSPLTGSFKEETYRVLPPFIPDKCSLVPLIQWFSIDD